MRWVVLLAVALPTCDHPGDDTAASCPHDPPLTYADFGKPFLEKYCTGCHGSLVAEAYRNGAPVGLDFDSWQGVVTNGPIILSAADGDPPLMPPGGGPNTAELADLREWMACDVLPTGKSP